MGGGGGGGGEKEFVCVCEFCVICRGVDMRLQCV